MVRTGKRTSTASVELPDRALARRIADELVRWYRRAARDLPWRRTRDPYAIWVSEVMLQQTQVASVIPYFERWLARFPNVAALARADEADVLHAWQGLGYYSRARALLRGAREIEQHHAGALPESAAELRTLPGIGPYTAGAIASIAFGERAPLVDGNVARVLARLFALSGDLSKNPQKTGLWALADALVPEASPSDFNQGLMELGATLCTPKSPRCDSCPLARRCRAHAGGDPERFPEPRKRPKPTQVEMAAGVVVRRGRVLLVRLPDTAPRWAKMWLFPAIERDARDTPEAAAARAVRELTGVRARDGREFAVIRHGVTRYRITLRAIRLESSVGTARNLRGHQARWLRPAELAELALPAAHARIAKRLLGEK